MHTRLDEQHAELILDDSKVLDSGLSGIFLLGEEATSVVRATVINGSEVARSGEHGIRARLSEPGNYQAQYEIHVQNSAIYDNVDYGIFVGYPGVTTAVAEYNWWGDESGPYNPARNPIGTGNEVSDDVDFQPWLTKPVAGISGGRIDITPLWT